MLKFILEGILVRSLRERLSLRLLRKMHRLTHRMPVELRPIKKASVLVIAPHMDDEAIGPGGTLLQHADMGSHVAVLFCAAGSNPDDDETRKKESKMAAQVMGLKNVEWLDYPDGNLTLHENDLGKQIAQRLSNQSFDQIFCPFITDHHRDHTAAAMGVAHAIRETGWRGEVWCYEIWSPLWPNVAISIGSMEARKRKLIEIYASQVASLHYTEAILGLNRYRGLRVYTDIAEAFYVSDSKNFCALTNTMNNL